MLDDLGNELNSRLNFSTLSYYLQVRMIALVEMIHYQ